LAKTIDPRSASLPAKHKTPLSRLFEISDFYPTARNQLVLALLQATIHDSDATEGNVCASKLKN
jgi:hypothetical protein